MTQRYYGFNRGQNAKYLEPTVGTSTGSTDMELRIDDTKLFNKKEIDILLERLVEYLREKGVNVPAA